MKRAPVLAVGISLALAAASFALETDQYWSWGLLMADSTDAVNAKLNLELERAIAGFHDDRPPPSCREIAVAYRSRMRSLLLHEIQVWAWNTRYVDRIPEGGDRQEEYRHTNLYSNHSLIDPGTWMPFTPTIEVAGVRIGTDKLAHLISSGWTYYGEYRKGIMRGDTPEEAERRAVRRGIIEENLILGKLTSGVLAISDLESSYAGMHFYIDLCDSEDPILKLEETGWVISRPIDLRDYVTPRWDESYQPPVFAKGRWRKVKPILETYCDRLDDPQVVAMRRRYRVLDKGSLVAEMIAERVAEGKIEDPTRFSIEAVCGIEDPSRGPPAGIDLRSRYATAPTSPDCMRELLIREDEERRSFALGLVGLQLSYPQVVAASIAIMRTSQPTSYDCTTPCDFRGPFAQIEPGIGGAKLSLGWVRVTGKTNRSGSFLDAAYIGAAYKATILRTWGNHGWVEGGRTYAGVEFGLPVAQANLDLGLLYRVDGGHQGRWMVTGGAGWGF